MTGPLHVTVACSDGCGVLGEGLTTDAAQRNRGPDWTRWAELNVIAEKHTKAGHSTVTTASVLTTGVTP